MAETHNVGRADQAVRVVLGVVCVGLVGYQFLVRPLLPLWGLIIVIILIPFFLKTGLTRQCPIMKAMGVSTNN